MALFVAVDSNVRSGLSSCSGPSELGQAQGRQQRLRQLGNDGKEREDSGHKVSPRERSCSFM